MTRCDYCGKRINELPFHCKFCGKEHCSNHRLPEEHKCNELIESKKHNQERWSEAIIGTQKHSYKKYKRKHHKKQDKEVRKYKLGFLEKTKRKTSAYASNLFYDVKSWLNHRDYRKYSFANRSNYLLSIILGFIIPLISFMIIYSNIEKLNEIKIWIIKLGGVLLLISLFFIIKYGYRLLKESFNLLKRQKNWIKYLIIILFLLLLWQAYTNKDTVLNPVFDIYNNTNFSYFAPVSLGNFSLDWDDKDISFDYEDSSGNKKNTNTKIKSPLQPNLNIYELENQIHDLINQERNSHGLSSLSFDSKLAEVAREHSGDMAQNNFFSHDNLRGQDPTSRANAKGYSCYKDFGSYYMEGIAENIFQNNLYDSITYVNLIPFHDWSSQSEIAQSTVSGWMDSSGHRENILTAHYDKEGIGVAISSDDEVYITQNFC